VSRIKALLGGSPVVLFMKGSAASPYCGFSRKVVDALTAAGVKSLYTLRAELWSAGARAAVRVQPPRSGLNVAADTVDDPASHPHYCHDPFFVTPDRWIVHGAPRPLPRRVGPCDPWDRQPHTSPPVPSQVRR
jgi:hypothetical protein